LERQGQPTSSGELFDNKKLTGAHRKLPLGATVRVTNLKNRESILLKINDRGPGIDGRVIDVSEEAAKELGFLSAGLARVEIDVMSFPNTCVQHMHHASSPRLN
jgi:rare lipoprotein A